MKHVLIFINIISLCIGSVTLVSLARRTAVSRAGKDLWTFLFFFTYTALVIVAAVTAYLVTNTAASRHLQLVSGSVTIAGMAFLEITFTGMRLSKTKPQRTRIPVFITVLCSTGTMAASLLLLIFGPKGAGIYIGAAFLFFTVIVAYNLLSSRSWKEDGEKEDIMPRKSLYSRAAAILYVLICAGAAVEVVTSLHSNEAFISASLPAAYILSSLQFLYHGSHGKGANSFRKIGLLTQKYSLTNRETEIVQLLLQGLSNKEIAYSLELSGHTVRNHIYNLYQKLGIQKRMDLVRLTETIE